MHVYFMRQEGTGFMKIGRANDPLRRLGNVRVGSPQPVYLVGSVLEHNGFSEKIAHQVFSEYWFRGEWFREEGRLADFVGNSLPWFVENSRNIKDGIFESKPEWDRRCFQLVREAT
jgi:hypothetical protein